MTSITPFSGTQEHTTTVNGQTAAVYNPDGVQYTYTGSVTFGLTGDTANATNSDEATQQLLNLMNLNNGLAPYSGEDPYYAPIAVCVNSQNNYAPISTASSTSCYPIPAGESCGGTNEGIILGDSDNQMVPGQSYTVNFTWSLPQGFSGTSMPIAAGINDGYNDIFNLTTDIIPDDVTSGYADPYEVNLSNNYTDNLNLTANNASGSTGGSTTSGNTNTNVPVVGATQPQLIVTPSSATIDVGGTQQYTDTYYPDGQLEGNGQDVTTSSTWTDNSTSIATIGSSTGLASGVGAGSTSITATYTDSNGNTLTGNASLTVQQSQKPPGTSGSYTGTLSMTAVNQATWSSTPMVTQDSQPAKKVTRPANTAKWTDQVTATLSATQEPDVSAYVPPNGVVTNVTWSIQSASISYPLKNPEFAVGNPVDPAVGATTSQDMTPSGQTATTQFLEEWSLDGVNGPGPGTGVYDILTGKVIAVNPSTWQIAASFTLTGSVSGYVPTQESNGNGGTTIVDIPFGPNQFTIQGTAEQDLTVDGAGALPQMSGDVRVIVSTD